MDRSARQAFSSLLLLTALAASDAFLTPGNQNHRNLITPLSPFIVESSHARRRVILPPNTSLHQSPGGGDDDDDDGSSTINIAFIATTIADVDDDGKRDELRTALANHPFSKMTGITLFIADVPAPSPSSPDTPSTSWNGEHLARLQNADIACFGTASAVTSYLRTLDDGHLDVFADISEEDRRKLPNKPDLVGDIMGNAPGAEAATATLMAACPDANTARECLNSGRWASNHIYYPKDAEGVVELKTEPIGGGAGVGEEGGGGEGESKGDEEIDVEVWAQSVVQAAGDVMERKFWGGGW